MRCGEGREVSRLRHPLGRDDPLASHYPSAGAPPVLAGLRKTPTPYREIPVIFVTASGSERIMLQARRLGASGVFAAPVDVDVLQGAIRAAMSR